MPKECTLDKTVFDFQCCPNTTFGVCGGPVRGSCADITADAVDPCDNGTNSDSKYCMAQQFLKSRPGTNNTDFRYKWPTQIFQRVCKCNENYAGYNCMDCKRGYTGKDCSQPLIVVRRNILSLSDAERDKVERALQSIKTNTASGYTVPLIQPVTTNPRESFTEISLFNLFVSFHFNAIRDEEINDCDSSSIISQFCNQQKKCPVPNFAHEGPAFPTWHRGYLLFVETELQRILGDPTFGLPYWDWTDERTRDEIWDIMGSSNCGIFAEPPATNNTVEAPINGPFSNWTTICTDAGEIVCNAQNQVCNPNIPTGQIQRCIGGTTGVQCRVEKMLPNRQEFERALKQRSYDNHPFSISSTNMGFRNSLEGFEYLVPRDENVCPDFEGGFRTTELHNRVHIYVGGTMLGVPISSNDPVFYLHHCNVDRLYEEWLNKYSTSNTRYEPNAFSYVVDPGHNIDDYLVPFFPIITNREMNNQAKSLGYEYASPSGSVTIHRMVSCTVLAIVHLNLGYTYALASDTCYHALYTS